MEAVINKKLYYSILGMPSSGTTIICRFFDSLKNGICVSEPMHRSGRNACRYKFIDIDEIKLEKFDANEFISTYKEHFLNSNYSIAGFKEVSLVSKGMTNRWDFVLNNENLFDFIIFILRDPVENINSIIEKGSFFKNVSFEDIIISYKLFLQNIKNTENKIILSYDEFCKNPIKHINEKSSKYFTIEGNLTFDKRKKGHIFALNSRGYKFSGINKRQLDNKLTSKQIEIIKRDIMPEYLKLLR